jgi:type I restriction enzyme, S subunit
MSVARPSTQLPKGWRRVAVKDMADSIQYGHTASAIQRKDGPRFLRITDIQDGRVDWSAVPSCDIPKDDVPKYRLAPGDLVFARTGATTGKSFLIGECPEAVFASYLIRVRVSAVVDSRYLATFFQSPDYWRQIEGGKRGIGQPNVNGQVLGQVQFPLPPLPEQRCIVAEIEKQFTRLEVGVAALRRVRANLKRYRAAVLKAACEGKLVPTEAALARQRRGLRATLETGEDLLARVLAERRDNSQGPAKYKEPGTPDTSGLPPLPEGWTYASVEQLGFVQLGRQRAPQHHKGENMRPYLRVANVFEDRLDLSDVMEMNFTPKEFETFQLKPNDILLNEGQSLDLVGRPAIYKGELPGACFTNTLVRFRPCASLNVKFALSIFRAFMHSGRFQKIAKWTTNIAHLGSDRFAKMAFPLPPLAEQVRIVAEVERRLSVVRELEAVVSANLQRAARLRQSILQKAFTGKL